MAHLPGNGFRKPLFLRICRLAGFPRAACWEMVSSGHFSYGGVRWRDLFGPIARKWLPEATCRIDLYAGGTSLGHLLGNGIRRPLFVCICTLAGRLLGKGLQRPLFVFVHWRDFFPERKRNLAHPR